MKPVRRLLLLLALATRLVGADAARVHVVLVGDSTVHDGGGWGAGFRAWAGEGLVVENTAQNGRSSKSFRAEGHWDRALALRGDYYLIQFGHNDQPGKGPARETDPATTYTANLARYVDEVRAIGGQPVLVTPLVRRTFAKAEPTRLVDTLAPYVAAVQRVVAEKQVPLVDLHALSLAYVEQVGPAAAAKFNPAKPDGSADTTHLNAAGQAAFARLVVAELRRVVPAFDSLLLREPRELADAAKVASAGEPAKVPVMTPSVAWNPDAGDGTYRNPVLHADYSDPDAVRVGEDYWMVSSSFSHVPGLPLLHSRDLVNWELTGHALPRLVPEDVFRTPQHGKGVWAPAIRFHAGRYWIYYPDPDFGLYVITATDPRGPWSAPVLVKAGKGLIDPCPLWDADGQVYLIHGWAKSRSGINNKLTLLRLSADGQRVEADLGYVIDGDRIPGCTTLEGPKLYQRNGWYYVFAPAGGVATGWQSVFRARAITGPYEHRIVLAQGSTPINGPHQGALVDTPAGDWWFLHFQDKDAYGRVVHLQPVRWVDDWPLMGTGVATGAEKGEPVLAHAKPALPPQPVAVPATSDDFAAPALGGQWQWQANPGEHWFSLTARPGSLRLFAQPAPKPGNLYDAPHLLLQKFPAPEFSVTTRLDLTAVADGDCAGLMIFGYDYAWVGLRRHGGAIEVVRATRREATTGEPEEIVVAADAAGARYFRVTVRAGGHCRFATSVDGRNFEPLGDDFTATVGRWVGAKVGLFATGAAGASADADFFTVTPPAP